MIIYFIIGAITLLLGGIIGGLIVSRKLKPQLRTFRLYDEETEKANNELIAKNEALLQEAKELYNRRDALQQANDTLSNSIEGLQFRVEEMEMAASTAADRFLKASMAEAEATFAANLSALADGYQEAEEKAKREYEVVIEEASLQCSEEINKRRSEIQQLTAEMQALMQQIAYQRATQAAIVEGLKRAEEMVQEQRFYRIQLTEADIKEIALLREAGSVLRDEEPLNKVIWKVYYEKPLKDLIGRVVGSGVKCGIYKITDCASGRCYVGQSVDLASRFIQHTKCALGAEKPTRNKLYPALKELGPENFTWEIIETCPKELLNEREDYWQDFYKALEFGYSIK